MIKDGHYCICFLSFSTSDTGPPPDPREDLSALSKDFDVYVRDSTPSGLSGENPVIAIRYCKPKDPEDS